MAHELSIRAAVRAEMAYAGETPWHGLGQSVTKGASVGVWMKEAGMDWSAKAAPVQCRVDVPKSNPGSKMFPDMLVTVDSHKVLYRSDTCEPLGIVGSGYQVVQPRDVLEFFRAETERGGWYIHTAGVLRGGRKLWAMATNGKLPAHPAGKKGDSIRENLLLATSLDGSMKTVAKLTSVVVVCQNTLNLALRDGSSVVTVSHRSLFDPRAIKRALGLAEDSFGSFIAQARDLAETPIHLDDATALLARVFGTLPASKPGAKLDTTWMGDLSKLGEPDEEEDEDPRLPASVSRCLELFDGEAIGAKLDGRAGTKWGLLNAVTQYVDHEMGRTPDSRLDQAWFGRGDTYKQATLERLLHDTAEA